MNWKIANIFNGECKGYLGVSSVAKPTENVGELDLAMEADTGDFYYFDGSAWAKVGGGSSPTPTPTPVTDLTGTTWLIKETPSLPTPAETYSLDFTCDDAIFYESFVIDGDNDEIAYLGTSNFVYTNGAWVDEKYRTVTVTGGSDATNAALIAWFESNATRVS